MPLKNTRLIPPGWQEHHAPVVLGGMEAWVRLSRPAGVGAHNPVTGASPRIPMRTYYEGPARIQTRGSLTLAAVEAGRELTTGNYLLAVPIDVGDEPRVGDLCDVLRSPDPLQVGIRLHLVDIPTASIILQRNLGADLFVPAPRGG
jgi:hypothetical protein